MFNFGKIVLIPFPFTDLTSSKVRPALIISAPNDYEDIIVAFITSNVLKNNFSIKKQDDIFQMSGLKTNSTIRFDKIATLSKKIVLGELGFIPEKILKTKKDIFLKKFGF